MLAKVSISFLNEDTDPQLVTNASTIVQALTENTTYPTPTPTVAAVGAALNTFTEAL